MKINEVIRKYRKDEKLTQEQLANYLGISAPAVNKWENGISYPDITLLAPLARILKIDVDTLLSFNEELSDAESKQLVKELSDFIKNEGFILGFERGEALLKEHPNCDILRLYTADILRLHLTVKETSNSELYENKIISWYEVILSSKDEKLANRSKSSLASFYMNKGEYQKSQQYLDELKTLDFDKQITQAILYERQSQNENAYELYENILFEEAHKINGVLQMICHLLCNEKKFMMAEKYANLSRDIALLLDLGDYTAYASNFLLAVEKREKASVIEMLEHMINGIDTYTDYMDSDLYSHKKFCKRVNFDSAKEIFRNALKNNSELDFVKNEPNAKKLFQKLSKS
jgi:transcriptional regulator with XRE-family HTH domain